MKRNKKVVKIMNNKLKRIIKKARLKTILLLAITIASNSFAWFIYTTEVKTNMDTRVSTGTGAYQYKDYGEGHFGLNFIYKFTFNYGGADNYADLGIFMITNTKITLISL